MKKILFYASMALLFTSCIGDDEPKTVTKMTIRTANHVVPEVGEPFIMANVLYEFEFEHNHSTAVMKVEDMALNTQTKLSFESEPVKFTLGNFTQGTIYRFEVDQINTLANGVYSRECQIEDLDCMLTTAYYAPSEMFQQSAAPLGTLVVMNYEIGDMYEVTTFPVSAFYSGRTQTQYTTKEGVAKTYSSNSALYGVNMNLATKKADIIIYDAQFAEEMPMKLTMALKNLDIELTREGYVIKGKNIVPLVGDDAIEYPRFAFDELVMVCEDDALTQVNINFTVAGQYKGSFTGSYVLH